MIKFYLSNPISFLSKTWKLILSLFFIPFVIYSQPTSQTFNASGTWTITSGSGYHATILVEVWGGGGGGAGLAPAGGGGGGAYSSTTYTNVGAGTYTVTVGAGGAGGVGSGGTLPGGNGGPSSFTRSGFITQTLAVGGKGGDIFGAAGAGGLATSGTGGSQKMVVKVEPGVPIPEEVVVVQQLHYFLLLMVVMGRVLLVEPVVEVLGEEVEIKTGIRTLSRAIYPEVVEVEEVVTNPEHLNPVVMEE